MSDDDGPASTGDSRLFAIFGFAILLLLVLPMTLWRVWSGGGAEVAVVQPWQKKNSSGISSGARLRMYMNRFNLVLLLLWAVIIALGLYISTIELEAEPFNPFTILGVSETATEGEIKKAFRTLSLKFHPDKNPGNPEASARFVEVNKAHLTLTDDTSKQNWIKYGHPDGPQAMNIGVALPEWVFASDQRYAPLVLLALVFLGLALPILAIAVYLHQAQGKVGDNQVQEATLVMYHRFAVREMLRVTKMYEAIVPAKEFMNIPVTDTQKVHFKSFSQEVVARYEVTRIPKWWNMEILRTYFFLVVYLDRSVSLIPQCFKKDFAEVLRLVPIMCEEFVKASVVPRNRFRRGWFMPAEAAAQFQQCTVQQVRPEVLMALPDERKKRKVSGETVAAMLQLPGMEEEIVRNLEKPHKIKSLLDLAALPEAERNVVLMQAGLPQKSLPDLHKMLLSLPQLHITKVEAFVEEEDDIKENDVLTVNAWVALTRYSHESLGGKINMKERSAGLRAFTPRFPHPVNEKWYIFLANQKVETPSTWAHTIVDLAEAEEAGVKNYQKLGCHWAPKAPAATTTSASSAASTATEIGGTTVAGGSSTEVTSGEKEAEVEEPVIGQRVQFKFLLHEHGKFNLNLVLMPSCWLGCSTSVPVTFTVLKQTAAEKAGKTAPRGKQTTQVNNFLDPDEVDNEDSDEEDDDDDGAGWDSDETGTDITHDDETDVAEQNGSTLDKKDA